MSIYIIIHNILRIREFKVKRSDLQNFNLFLDKKYYNTRDQSTATKI